MVLEVHSLVLEVPNLVLEADQEAFPMVWHQLVVLALLEPQHNQSLSPQLEV